VNIRAHRSPADGVSGLQSVEFLHLDIWIKLLHAGCHKTPAKPGPAICPGETSGEGCARLRAGKSEQNRLIAARTALAGDFWGQ